MNTLTSDLAGAYQLSAANSMNKTEAEWAYRLNLMILTGEIVTQRYEPLKFRLARNTTYTPDFMVICPKHIEMHEIKGGFYRDDARAKGKIAAEMYPFFKWGWAQKKKGVGKVEVYGGYSWQLSFRRYG